MKKPKVRNLNYVWASKDRLIGFIWRTGKPWTFILSGDIYTYPTHAEAIQHADKLAREQS